MWDVRITWGAWYNENAPVSEANDSESGELEWDREHLRYMGKEWSRISNLSHCALEDQVEVEEALSETQARQPLPSWHKDH